MFLSRRLERTKTEGESRNLRVKPLSLSRGERKEGAYFFFLLCYSLSDKQAHAAWTLCSKGRGIAKPFNDQHAPVQNEQETKSLTFLKQLIMLTSSQHIPNSNSKSLNWVSSWSWHLEPYLTSNLLLLHKNKEMLNFDVNWICKNKQANIVFEKWVGENKRTSKWERGVVRGSPGKWRR